MTLTAAAIPAMAERIEVWPVERLIPYAGNARTHSDEQVNKVAASMVEFGFTNPILVDGRDGIVAGHCRLAAARRIGLKTVPVVVLDHLTDAQRRAYILADNRLALDGGWDDQVLAAELARLREGEFNLDLIGFSDEEMDALLAVDGGEEDGGAGSGEEETIPEPPATPVTQPGDLWVLGEHRLLCGSSINPEDVTRLMNGEHASLFATDPPYLVDYDGHNRPCQGKRTIGKDWSGSYGVTWDDSSQGPELYEGFIKAAIDHAITLDAAWYCWHASKRQAMLEEIWEKFGAFVHQFSKYPPAEPGALFCEPLKAAVVKKKLGRLMAADQRQSCNCSSR